MDFNIDNLESLFFDQNSNQNYSSKDASRSHDFTSGFPLLSKSLPLVPDDDILLTQAFRTPWKPPPSQNQGMEFQPSQAKEFPQDQIMEFSQSQTNEFPASQIPSFNKQSRTNTSSNQDHRSFISRSPLGVRSSHMPGRVGVVAPSQLVRPERVSRPLFKTPANKDSELPGEGDKEAPISDMSQNRHMTQLPSSMEDMFPAQEPQDTFTFTPAPFNLPNITPGGSRRGMMHLRSIDEVPDPYRNIFSFPYFNIVQSKVFDDVFYSDKPIVLCAPTGSGKTVIFELAIIRLILTQHGSTNYMSKIVYMAPIKALCSERYEDWKIKFGALGLTCMELTGDSEIDYFFDLEEVHIILTTPEKWDSMTRRWRNNKSMVQKVRLFLIDEVHTLNDESRGATMEAVISRMKTVHKELTRENISAGNTMKAIRFVAVSATIPNVQDVGDWLSLENEDPATYNMDDTHRPVRLRKVVLGYPCSEGLSGFRFDLSLNYKLATIIQTYSDQKPTLVFCATRKGTAQAAGIVIKDARFIMNPQHKQRLQKAASSMKDSKLRELVMSGVAYHHAGLDLQDRKAVESMFTQGDIPVLFATSTLAMGVNLPAHLVVVKSTQHYVMGMYQEYTETQILQMIGRAGRPQFDTTATAVILTKMSTKSKYEDLLSGNQLIESSLHQHLVEHLNAEIVLNTIRDVSVALEWAKSTFLYIRMLKNPKHYGLARGLAKEKVEQHLQELCLKNLNALANFNLVKMDDDFFVLNSTENGRLMARYCIAFDTMKNFHQVSGTESIEELLQVFCESQEFRDVQLRVTDKKILNSLNKDKQRQTIRFPMNGKIKSKEMKVNCLLQAQLSSLTIQEFSLQQDINKINRASLRVVRCLVEVLWQKQDQFRALLNAVLLSKCIKARLWENSKHVTRQLTGIGNMLANALVNAGVTSFQKVEEKNPRDIELTVNRHPPFGRHVKEAVAHLPKYDLCIDQVTPYSKESSEITIIVNLANAEFIQEKATADKAHTCALVIGDMDNNVIYKARISDALLLREGSWCKKMVVKRAKKGEELSVNLISQDWVGLDVQSMYTPVYTGPRTIGWSSGADNGRIKREKVPLAMTTGPDSESDSQPWQQEANFDLVLEDDFETTLEPNRKPCSHSCKNKRTCSHLCCKNGVIVRDKRPVMMDKFRQQLKHKLQAMPASTPQIKHNKTAPGLQQFAYTPNQAVLPRTTVSDYSTSRVPNQLPGTTHPVSTPGIPPMTPPGGRPMPPHGGRPMPPHGGQPMAPPSVHLIVTPQTPRYNPGTRPPLPAMTPVTPKGWEGLDLFEKRYNATKEWNYDTIYEEPQIGAYQGEGLIRLSDDFQRDVPYAKSFNKENYDPDCVIEDFQGSPELVGQFHRDPTQITNGSKVKPWGISAVEDLDDLPDLRPHRTPRAASWAVEPPRPGTASWTVDCLQPRSSSHTTKYRPAGISGTPWSKSGTEHAARALGYSQDSMNDFDCDEIIGDHCAGKQLQLYKNNLPVRPQYMDLNRQGENTKKSQVENGELSRFDPGLCRVSHSEMPQSVLRKPKDLINRSFNEIAQRRINSVRSGLTVMPHTGAQGYKIVEKYNPDEFTDSDMDISTIGCEGSADVMEMQRTIRSSSAQDVIIKNNSSGKTRVEPAGVINTTSESNELLAVITEPEVIEASAPDIYKPSISSQELVLKGLSPGICEPSTRSQELVSKGLNPGICEPSTSSHKLIIEAGAPDMFKPGTRSPDQFLISKNLLPRRVNERLVSDSKSQRTLVPNIEPARAEHHGQGSLLTGSKALGFTPEEVRYGQKHSSGQGGQWNKCKNDRHMVEEAHSRDHIQTTNVDNSHHTGVQHAKKSVSKASSNRAPTVSVDVLNTQDQPDSLNKSKTSPFVRRTSILNDNNEPNSLGIDHLCLTRKPAMPGFGSMFSCSSGGGGEDIGIPPFPCLMSGTAHRDVPTNTGMKAISRNIQSSGLSFFSTEHSVKDLAGAQEEHSGIFDGIF